MSWDYIVIGAGSAGCALTHALVSAGRKVLLLEAGGSDRSPFIKLPAAVLRAANKYDWGYRSQPDPTRNGAAEKWLRGRVLGGSSSINGMIYIRGDAGDFDRWAEHCGNVGGWSSRELMPIYRAIERSDQAGSLRGRDGPLNIRTIRRPHAVTRAFIESAAAAGLAFNPDYNDAMQEGVSFAQLTQRRGLRCSAADAFIRPVLKRKNLKLLLNATATRVDFANGCAAAVVFRHRDQVLRETAREVVLCAGAINTPKLLMLSGIGDPQELHRHGIKTRLDLPGVGRNLKDHPVMRLVYRSKIPTYNLTEGLSQRLQIAMKFALLGEGPIATPFESVGFLKTTPSLSTPDIQLIFVPIGTVGKIGVAYDLLSSPSFKVYVIRSHPRSSGRIRLASGDPDAPPLIECRLLDDSTDIEILIKGIDRVRAIMRTEPIAGLIEEEMIPGPAMGDTESLSRFIRDHAETAYHVVGTCRMGFDGDAVVDPDLRLRGAENLWVADASIMPDLISANTNAPSIMIGAKLGKQLIAR